MRFAMHFRFNTCPWRATLLAIALGASGLATAQAPVARAEISADLLLSLLGSGKAIEIDLPDDVRAVHVVATQGDAVVLDRSTEFGERTEGQSASIVVSVGAVGATLRCPLIVFIDMRLYLAERRSGAGMNATCMEVEAPASLWPAPRAGLYELSFEVRRWYAIDGFWPAEMGPGAPRPTEADVVVFHVYLATDDAAPPLAELGITDQ